MLGNLWYWRKACGTGAQHVVLGHSMWTTTCSQARTFQMLPSLASSVFAADNQLKVKKKKGVKHTFSKLLLFSPSLSCSRDSAMGGQAQAQEGSRPGEWVCM